MQRQEGEDVETDPYIHGIVPHSSYDDAVKFRSFVRRTIFLDDDVREDTASTIVLELSALSMTPEPITLRISSNGGDVSAELAVIDAIEDAQRKGCQIIGEVYGHGMSAAFMILQACDVRRMGRNSILMVHGITTWVGGDSKNIKAEQGLLEELQIRGAQNLASRSTAAESKYTTVDFWQPILEDNTPIYLFPDQALEWGVIDEVVA